MKKRPIVIMAAMENESTFLLEKLDNLKINVINKYKFYEGTIENFPVIVCQCGIMTINATIATHIAIEKYNPIAIISQGTAGAHNKEIHTGDIVIGEKCINIVSCKTPSKKEGEGSNSLDWELLNFIAGEEDKLKYQISDENLLKIARKVSYSNGNTHYGILGSGDIWNKEKDKILWLHDNYHTLCEDMESIAIYTVCNNFNIPVIGMRIISNNELLNEAFDSSTTLLSQEFVYELILKLINE